MGIRELMTIQPVSASKARAVTRRRTSTKRRRPSRPDHQVDREEAAAGGAGGPPEGPTPPAEQARGLFVTKESLTFPGAAALVSFLLLLADIPFNGAQTSFLWALLVSFGLGVLIYWFSITPGMSRSEKAKGAAVALLNVLVLTGSALGIGSAASDDPVTLTPEPAATSTPNPGGASE